MTSFATLADVKALESEAATWADRDVARTMHQYVTRARDAHGARPAISYQLLSAPDAPKVTLTWNELHGRVTQAAWLLHL